MMLSWLRTICHHSCEPKPATFTLVRLPMLYCNHFWAWGIFYFYFYLINSQLHKIHKCQTNDSLVEYNCKISRQNTALTGTLTHTHTHTRTHACTRNKMIVSLSNVNRGTSYNVPRGAPNNFGRAPKKKKVMKVLDRQTERQTDSVA